MGEIPQEQNHCSPNRWREDVVRGQKWRGQAQETFVVSFLSQDRMPEREGSSLASQYKTVIRTDGILIVSFFRASAA